MSEDHLFHHRGTPADALIRGAHVIDPREGIDAPLDILVRDGDDRRARLPGVAAGHP